MTPFEQWCKTEAGREAIRLAQGPHAEDVLAKECLAKAWNAALDAANHHMLTCCCTHQREEHKGIGIDGKQHETLRCNHPGCDCANLCDCWMIVCEMNSDDHPEELNKILGPLRVTP